VQPAALHWSSSAVVAEEASVVQDGVYDSSLSILSAISATKEHVITYWISVQSKYDHICDGPIGGVAGWMETPGVVFVWP
jgi:hypothetical protein